MSDTPRARFVAQFPVEAVLRDYTDAQSGLRFLVARGPYSFCAYVGVRADHVLAELEDLEFECHFGVTYRAWGQADSLWPVGWHWWGWDYAHFLDAISFEASLPDDAPEEMRQAYRELEVLHTQRMESSLWGKPKNWTLDEVAEDAMDVLMSLKSALLASEKLAQLVVTPVATPPAPPPKPE